MSTKRELPQLWSMLVTAVQVAGRRRSWLASLSVVAATVFMAAVAHGQVLSNQEVRRLDPPPGLIERGLQGDPLLRKGYLNVRHYACGDGKTDDTAAIRRALADALEYDLAVYFPQGTYLVSDTLDCVKRQKSYVRGYFLIGDPLNRPVIKLKDGADGFGDPSEPRYVVKLWQWDVRSSRPDGDYGAALMNSAGIASIIVDCGRGNAGAVGLKCWGSQGVYVEDLTVRAHGALAGIRDLVGNGGYMANIEVVGGKYGIWAVNGQPGCIAGLTLIDQEEAAIRQNMATWAFSVAGFRIVKDRGPVVELDKDLAQNAGHHLSLVDGSIELRTPSTALVIRKDTLGRAGNLYLRNVYVHNAQILIDEQGAPAVAPPAHNWARIMEYVNSSIDTRSLINGEEVTGPVREILIEAPQEDLVGRHALPARALGFGLEPNACDVRNPPAGMEPAKGDGIADDTDAIQALIDRHERVFLPRGIYRLTAPLRLRKNTVLYGITSALTALYGDAQHWRANQERTVITTEDDGAARCVAAQFTVYTSSTEPAGGLRVIHWRAGRDSVVKNLFTKSVDWPGIGWPSVKLDFAKGDLRPVNIAQLALIDGSGGGRWYGCSIGCENYCPVVPRGYRHVSVLGTHEPLRFYSLNPEHAFSDVEFEIRNSRDIAIFGLKTEGGGELLAFNTLGSAQGALFRIADSRDILITAFTNNGKIPPSDRGMFEIERCENFALATLSVARRGQGNYALVREERPPKPPVVSPAERNVGLFRRD